MSILDNLPHTATAYKRTRTQDSMGGSKDSLGTALFTGTSCWRQPASNSEIKEYQQRDQIVTHKVFFVADPLLDETHILVIDGDTHSVRSSSHPDSSLGLSILWKVMVRLEESTST